MAVKLMLDVPQEDKALWDTVKFYKTRRELTDLSKAVLQLCRIGLKSEGFKIEKD
jgi:hypothetical protein